MTAVVVILVCTFFGAALIAVLSPKKKAPLPPLDRQADDGLEAAHDQMNRAW